MGTASELRISVPNRGSNWRRLLRFCFLFIVLHYFFWGVPLGFIFYFLYSLPYGSILLSVALALYIRSFIDGSEFKLGRPWDWVISNPAWRLWQEYVNLQIIRKSELSPKSQYIFAIHPHSILILSRMALFGGMWRKLFPEINVRFLAASPMFYMPGCRELCLWCGAVRADKHIARNLLEQGINLIIYPGGSAEIFTTDPDSLVTELKLATRKGFVKLALRCGVPLVPVYVFGEKWCYRQKQLPAWFKQFFYRHMRLPLILFWGRFFTWVPYNVYKQRMVDVGVVFGEPIPVQKVSDPTQEQIDKLHKQYVDALQGLFDEYKAEMGYDDEETIKLV